MCLTGTETSLLGKLMFGVVISKHYHTKQLMQFPVHSFRLFISANS